MKKYFLIILVINNLIGCSKDKASWVDQNYKESIIQYENGELEKAKKGFLKNYENYEEFNVVNLYLGKIFFYQGSFKKALEYFELLKESSEHKSIAEQWIIKTKYVLKNDKLELLNEIESINEKSLDNIEILLIQAKLLLELGKVDESIKVYNKVIQNGYLIAIAHNDLSSIYQKAKIDERYSFHKEIYKTLSQKYNFNKKGKN
jgi:tetratricopeptide (TPR) repeat protein